MLEPLKKRTHILAAYASLLYFFEIIYIMIALLFLYGKPLSVLTGLTLSTLLSIQIVGIYQKRDTNRKIQLYMMDFHFAYAVSFLLSMAIFGFTGSAYDAAFIVLRSVLAVFEFPVICLLTDDDVKSQFAKS